ncbi:unnamed protein product [Diamesa tonsa]
MEVLKSKVVSIDLLEQNTAGPILAFFQNGFSKSEVSCTRVEDEETKKNYAVVATQSNIYCCDTKDENLNAHLNTFLAIRNKRTNKTRLVQVMQGNFKSQHYDDDNSKFKHNILDQKILHRKFGGKKALAKFEKREKTTVNVEVLAEAIEKTLDNIGENFFEEDIFDKDQAERVKLANEIFPTMIGTTKNPREVYTLEALIGDAMITNLESPAYALLETAPSKLPFINTYLTDIIKAIQVSKEPDTPFNIRKVITCIYTDALIRLINTKHSAISTAELSLISADLEKEIRKKFIQAQVKQAKSKYTEQKAIIYYLLLTLLASDNLEVHLDHVIEGLNVSKKTIMKYAAVFGGRVKRNQFLYLSPTNMDPAVNLKPKMIRKRKQT